MTITYGNQDSIVHISVQLNNCLSSGSNRGPGLIDTIKIGMVIAVNSN